jgi:hypothetical protein
MLGSISSRLLFVLDGLFAQQLDQLRQLGGVQVLPKSAGDSFWPRDRDAHSTRAEPALDHGLVRTQLTREDAIMQIWSILAKPPECGILTVARWPSRTVNIVYIVNKVGSGASSTHQGLVEQIDCDRTVRNDAFE